MEQIKNIEDFIGYKVSNLGKFYSFKNNRWGLRKEVKEINSTFLDKKGYPYVRFYFNGVKSIKKAHRLVAIAFVENPKNKPDINHIDGDKTNNHFSNLEWVTNPENMKHARELGLYDNSYKKRMKAVSKYDFNGNFIKTYKSINEAAIDVGLKDHTSISKVLSGVQKTAGGYEWKFK